MKYLMLVCWDAEKMDAQSEPEPNENAKEESFPWLDDLRARGIWVTGDQLASPRRARSVRVRDGKTLVTDGPFAETKEFLVGYWIVEVSGEARALDIAARVSSCPGPGGTPLNMPVEVRQVMPGPCA